MRENIVNFVPVPLQAVKGDLRRPHDGPVSDSVVLLEMSALLVLGEFDEWSQSQLAKRFRCGKARLVKCAGRLADQFRTMNGPAADQWRTAILEKFPQLTGNPGPAADRQRTDSGPRARSSLKIEEKEQENAADAAPVDSSSSKAEKAAETREHTAEFQALAALRSGMALGPDHGLTKKAKTNKPAKGLLDMYRKLRGRGITADQIRWLVLWAFLAPDDAKPGSAFYLRTKGYTTVRNLLVDDKADDRIERARKWWADRCPVGRDVDCWIPDEVTQRQTTTAPKPNPDEPAEGDMVAVVLSISAQLQEGTHHMLVRWPSWLPKMDERRIPLESLLNLRPEHLRDADDPDKARRLLGVA